MSGGSRFGGVRRLGPGRYQTTIYIAGTRERHLFPTQALANAHLAEKRKQKVDVESGAVTRRGLKPAVSYRELGPELEQHWAAGARRVHTRRTLEGYRSDLRAVLEEWGPRTVAGTREVDVEAWIKSMRTGKLSSSTIRHRLDRLSQLHQLAVRRGYLPARPCQVDRPRVILSSEPTPISEKQLGKLVAAAGELEDRRVLAIILLAADAGLRVGELARLRGEDIRKDYIHVAVRGESDRTKSGRGRDVPIYTRRLREALERLRPRAGRRLLQGLSSESGITYAVDRVWRDALRVSPRLHSARHRFGTLGGMASDVTPVQLMRLLGHQSLATTMRYVHEHAGKPGPFGELLEGRSGHSTGNQRRATRGARRRQVSL